MPRIKKIPQRTCVGCGKVADKRELVRVVRTPDGEVAVDPTGKKSGRGAYICRSSDCLARAARAGKLSRALDAEVPEEVIRMLQEGLSGVDE